MGVFITGRDVGRGMSRTGRYGAKELYIFDYAFLGAYNVAVFEDVWVKLMLGGRRRCSIYSIAFSVWACMISIVVGA